MDLETQQTFKIIYLGYLLEGMLRKDKGVLGAGKKKSIRHKRIHLRSKITGEKSY